MKDNKMIMLRPIRRAPSVIMEEVNMCRRWLESPTLAPKRKTVLEQRLRYLEEELESSREYYRTRTEGA